MPIVQTVACAFEVVAGLQSMMIPLMINLHHWLDNKAMYKTRPHGSRNLLDESNVISLEENATYGGVLALEKGGCQGERTQLPSRLRLLNKDLSSLIHHQVHELVESLYCAISQLSGSPGIGWD